MLVKQIKHTCAGTADNTVVDVGAAINCDLQTVVSIMVLCWLIIRVELGVKQKYYTHSKTWFAATFNKQRRASSII